MALDTMDKLIAGLAGESRTNLYKASQTSKGAGCFHSLYKAAGYPPAATSNPATGSGEIPTADTLGAIPITDAASGAVNYLCRTSMTGSTPGTLIMYDRLWQNSGLVGNVITSQTVNSLTLTRTTSGLGVEIFLEVYSVMGATASTFSCTYTDANNVSRVAKYSMAASALVAGQVVQLTPPVGAAGCKSIQSIILSASTGTAGNFGLFMGRRLAEIPLSLANVGVVVDPFGLGIPSIDNGACICGMVLCSTTNTGVLMGSIDVVDA